MLIHLAYIDSGTGSMALQAAIAGVLSAAFFVKTRWHSIREAVSRKNKKVELTSSED